MSQDINQSILAALEAGYGHQDILDAFSKSSNPEHQSFYENYTQNMRDRAKEFDLLGTKATPGLGVMKRVRKHVEETPGEQLAAEGAGLAALGYAGKRAIQRALPTPGEKALFEQNEISRKKLEFEKEQAAKFDVAKLDKELAKQEFNKAKAVTEEVQHAATVADAQKRIEAFNNLQQQKAPVPAPVTPEAPVQGVAPPITQAPAVTSQVTPEVPTVTEAVQTGQSPTKAIQADLAPMVYEAAPAKSAPPPEKKKRAPKVQETFKSIADIPEGTVFRPDIGNLDRTLYNIVGAEHRRNAMELLNKGQPFGEVPDTNKAISPLLADYWKNVQGQIPETILSRKEREKLGVKTDFGNYGGLGRYAKVGGVVGTLLTAAQAANATQEAQQGNTAPAKEMGFDLTTAALLAKILGGAPAFGAALGLGSKELATGTLDSPEARALGVRPPR